MSEHFDNGDHVLVETSGTQTDNRSVSDLDNNETQTDNRSVSDLDENETQTGGRSVSDSDISNLDDSGSESEIEYEEIDLMDNPLYQVLSTLFEDEEGNNLCTIMKSLVQSVDANTKLLNKLLKKKS